MPNRVVIIGVGALGKCFAALLMSTSIVTVYERSPIVRQKLCKDGFIFKEGGRAQKIRVRVVDSLSVLGSEEIDVLIFATKVMDLDAAVNLSAKLKPRCVFLPQNGIFGIEQIKKIFHCAYVCRGVTTMACSESLTGKAELYSRGTVYVGGEGGHLVARLFRDARMKVRVYKDPAGLVFSKLIFNAVMNALPVITGQGYDILSKDRRIYALVRQGIKEGCSVARALDVRLAFDPMKMILRVKHGDLAGIAYRGSMFGDVAAGRATEIDCITGALIRAAHGADISVPALEMIYKKAKIAGA